MICRTIISIFGILILISIVIIGNLSLIKPVENYKESDYQTIFLEYVNGHEEVVLDDRSRVDIITNEHAIEIDYANKWAEAVGQSLFYALKTNKKPGIVLILKDNKNNNNYIKRTKLVSNQYDITLWTISEKLEIKKIPKGGK